MQAGISLREIGRYEYPAGRVSGKSRSGQDDMGNALRDWLEAHGLLAIIAVVLGVIVALSLLFVVGGYYLVTP